MINETSIEEEFKRIEEEIGNIIYVITVNSKGEEGFYAKLDSVHPYDYLGLITGRYDDGVFEGELRQLQPFIGAVAGIKSIETRDKEIIYHNGNLKFGRDEYNPFLNPEDNEHINKMRRAKFGDGHDYELDEEMVSYLKGEVSKKEKMYLKRLKELSAILEEDPEFVIELNKVPHHRVTGYLKIS